MKKNQEKYFVQTIPNILLLTFIILLLKIGDVEELV